MKEKIALLWQDKRVLLLLLALLCAASFLPAQEGMTQEEKRISRTLSQIDGAGRVQVTLFYTESGSAFGGGKTCTGALAVCEGAGDIAVRLRLMQALETLLGLDSRQVAVLKMEESL
ncbi:MAG: hypothetical protein IJA59_06575 [Clostridia bacterium]|nr:hypothetical protein [Clostridia bacterium]